MSRYGSIEYRKLQRNGKCGCCDREILAGTEEVSIVHLTITRSPQVCICRECANKIFYAPVLVDKNGYVREGLF